MELAQLSEKVEQVLIQGDLAQLAPQERVNYYQAVCQSVGLNPLTKPFEYLNLNGKLTLYALKGATDQLRQIHGVSITKLDREVISGAYVVTAHAVDKQGREDSDMGIVPVEKEDGDWQNSQSGKRYFKGNGTFKSLTGDELANAMLKAVTKAKRRVTLSICGLGMLDETEVETIPGATREPVEIEVVDDAIGDENADKLEIRLREILGDFYTQFMEVDGLHTRDLSTISRDMAQELLNAAKGYTHDLDRSA